MQVASRDFKTVKGYQEKHISPFNLSIYKTSTICYSSGTAYILEDSVFSSYLAIFCAAFSLDSTSTAVHVLSNNERDYNQVVTEVGPLLCLHAMVVFGDITAQYTSASF